MKKIVNYLLELLFYFVVFTIVLYIGSIFKLTTFGIDRCIAFTIGYALGNLIIKFFKRK